MTDPHTAQSLPRTYLYVPGNADGKLAKALTRGADALILDLEDAVPLAEKDAARQTVVDWLRQQQQDLGVELDPDRVARYRLWEHVIGEVA